MTLLFSIYSYSHKLDELKSNLKLNFSSTWHVGDKLEYNATAKENCLECEINSNTIFLEDLIKEFLSRINDNDIEIICKCMQTNDISVKFCIVSSINNEFTPSLYFNRKFLSLVHKFNAEIDVDLYQ